MQMPMKHRRPRNQTRSIRVKSEIHCTTSCFYKYAFGVRGKLGRADEVGEIELEEGLQSPVDVLDK